MCKIPNFSAAVLTGRRKRCMQTLHANAASKRCITTLHQNAASKRCITTLHKNAARQRCRRGSKIGDKFMSIRRGDEDSTRFKKGAPTGLILVEDTGSAGVAREKKVPSYVEERRLF